MSDIPETLGEALSPVPAAPNLHQRAILGALRTIDILLITTLTAIPIWWMFDVSKTQSVIAIAMSVCVLKGVLVFQRRKIHSTEVTCITLV